MREQWQQVGNPSSLHTAGRRARKVVEESREQIAELIGAKPADIVFTSGGTEADNLGIKGIARSGDRRRILVSAVEHHAVLDPAEALAHEGFEVELLPVDHFGRVDMARLEAALAELCARGIPPAESPAEHREAFCALARQAEPRLTVRQAVFAPQETIPAGSALGRVCALPTVSCPPAIPMVVSGEVIGPAALELFAAYGVETVSVVKPEKF